MPPSRSLRDLIDQRLTANFGPRAWKRAYQALFRTRCNSASTSALSATHSRTTSTTSLAAQLTQCNFGDYGNIIKSNWPLFEDVFSDKTTFDRQMQAVQDARNAFAHHRELNEGEQQTAAGGLYWFEQCLRRAARPEEETKRRRGDEKTLYWLGLPTGARD